MLKQYSYNSSFLLSLGNFFYRYELLVSDYSFKLEHKTFSLTLLYV